LVGGVIMWVPAAIIESVGGLLAMRQWLRLSRSGRIRRKPWPRRTVPVRPVPATQD
jgi:putative membrane protein